MSAARLSPLSLPPSLLFLCRKCVASQKPFCERGEETRREREGVREGVRKRERQRGRRNKGRINGERVRNASPKVIKGH